MEEKKPKIAIATHAFEMVDFDVYYNHLFAISHWLHLYDVTFLGRKGLQAAEARNLIIDQAISGGCEWIFFLDADHLIPRNALLLLMENKDEAMTSGLICKRGYPYSQVGWCKSNDGYYLELNLPLDGKVYEVAVCAFGCTLINVAKIQKLERPIFRDTCEKNVAGDLQNVRSDINLCEAFRAAGEKIWIDTRVLVGHRMNNSYVYPQSNKFHQANRGLTLEMSKLRGDMTGSCYLPEVL